MKVAAWQCDIAWENPKENLQRFRVAAHEAATKGVDLLVLPEMFATGFSMHAENVASNGDHILDEVREVARKEKLWIMAGIALASEPMPLNSCLVFDRNGDEVGRYAKIHPFSLANEGDHYGAGEESPTFEIEGMRVTPFICYDLRFAEIFRAAAETTDLFVVIANWPARRGEAWRVLVRARAVENQCFLLAANRVGEAEGVDHDGDSGLYDPDGASRVSLSRAEGLVIGECGAEDVAAHRRRFSFLRDRRPTLYQRLNQSMPEENSP